MESEYNTIGKSISIKEQCRTYKNQVKLDDFSMKNGYHRKITAFAEESNTKPSYNGKNIDYVLFDKSDNKNSKESVLRLFTLENNELYQVLVRKKDKDGDRIFQKNGKRKLEEIAN